MGLNKLWTDHLPTAKEKQEFAKLVQSSLVLRRLSEIVYKLEKELDRRDTNEDYSSPAWPYEQADRLGYRRGLAAIKKLLPDQEI